MRITSKGQVTIPVAIREKAGLMPNTEVEFEFDGETVRLRKAPKGKPGRESRGQRAVRLLRESGARSRIKLTTDEIMAMFRGR
jgi:AbrB family looped-hinge helix DNA binding protein